jgi:hypothetical protein
MAAPRLSAPKNAGAGSGMGGTGDGSGVGSGLGGSGSGSGMGLGRTSGPLAAGTSGDMGPSTDPELTFVEFLHNSSGGLRQCRDGKCWLPLPHGSGTIVNLTPAARTAVNDVIQFEDCARIVHGSFERDGIPFRVAP